MIFKTEKQVIEEIHSSFDNAQEELLAQALKIMNATVVDDKAERLEKIGFTSSKTVLKNKDKREALVKSKEDADLVNYYKQNYPFLKFLKEEQLDAICDKYNLIYAPISRYNEDVPEKNISDIENAQDLNDNDFVGIERIYVFSNSRGCYRDTFNVLVREFGGTSFTHEEIVELINKYMGDSHLSSYYKKNPTDLFWALSQYGIHPESKNNIAPSRIIADCSVKEVNKTGLFIAAPQSHFNLEGLKKHKKGFLKITTRKVKDPIVFRYVRGGIQVITKWGLEADDESLRNETLN